MAFRLQDQDDLGDMSEINVTLTVALPAAEGKSFELASNAPARITIASSGAVYVDGTPAGSQNLEMTLGTMLRGRRVKKALLEADKGVPYGRVVAVLDIMNRAGVEELGMVTRPGDGDARPRR